MATEKIYFDKAAVISNATPSTNIKAGSTFEPRYDVGSSYYDLLLVKLGDPSYLDQLKFRPFLGATLYIYAFSGNFIDSEDWLVSYICRSSFDENTVSYLTRPSTGSGIRIYYYSDNFPAYNSRKLDRWDFRDAMQYGACIQALQLSISTPYGSNQPYILLEYGDEDVGVTITPTYPIGAATISRSLDTTFTWDAKPETTNTIGATPAAETARLRWRYKGASSYTEVACNSATQHTIPAGTFTDGTIEWQAVVTANSGAVTESAWTTTEVKEPVSSASVVSPVSSVLDGTAEQTFVWEHIISNGTAQYAFELQTSPDNAAWTTIRSQLTDATSTTFAAGTFDAGDLWWRVRTYNLSNIPSEWSEAAHCIVIAAPDTPVITADYASPRFVLRWQQSGQQAYELMIDGEVIAKTHSAESIYRYDGYLEPGTYTVRVRIQNKFQMWSEWGTASLQIKNVEGAAIQLTASGENEVQLSWNTSGAYSGYLVYRNGVKIGETAAASFTDHFAVGEASYQVRGVYRDSGYYTLSNTAAVTIVPKTLMIAAIDNPVWISMPLSASSLRSTGLTASQSVTYTHFIGSGLPDAEIGEAVSKTYSLECAWLATDLTHIGQFEALLGKTVCVKTPSQRRIIGVVSQMSVRENRFYVAYTVPITEVRWEGL